MKIGTKAMLFGKNLQYSGHSLLNFLTMTKLIHEETVEALKRKGVIKENSDQSGETNNPSGGFFDIFSIKPELQNIASGRSELDTDEEKSALDGFIVFLKQQDEWWKYWEFIEEFGDADPKVPSMPKTAKGQATPQKIPKSQIAGLIKDLLKEGAVVDPSTGAVVSYDNSKMYQWLNVSRGFFNEEYKSLYYGLYMALEGLKGTWKSVADKLVAGIQKNTQQTTQSQAQPSHSIGQRISQSAHKVHESWNERADKEDEATQFLRDSSAKLRADTEERRKKRQERNKRKGKKRR